MEKIGRLVVFLLFWATISTVVAKYSIYKELSLFDSIKDILMTIITGQFLSACPQLWFLISIIGLYILAPAIKIVTEHASKELMLYVIIVCIFVSVIAPHISRISCLEYLSNCFETIHIEWLEYFLLGYFLDEYSLEKKQVKIIEILGLICVPVTIIIAYNFPGSLGIGEYLWPTVMISSAAAFLFFKDHFNSPAEGGFGKSLKFIGDRSLGIYGVHNLIIFGITRTTAIATLPMIFSIPLLVVIAAGLAVLISFLLSKIPVVGKYIV